MSEVTEILLHIEAGDPSSAEALLPLIYSELRALAAAKLRNENPGQTLDPTALVHEAYLRLVNSKKIKRWDSRGHFFAAAAEAMRRILIEKARRKRFAAEPGRRSQSFSENGSSEKELEKVDILALNDALLKLEIEHPQRAQIVMLRFFSGLKYDEIAAILNLSPVTVKRHWRFARVWLHREMQIAE